MERHEIEAFLMLAEELHFGRTAERLRVSQARVSQTIKTIERRIGAPLFDRSSRHVTLTSLGDQLRADLEPHHRGIQEAIGHATDTARGITGPLRVGFTCAWSGHLILQAADRFRARHPACTVEIQEDTYNTALEALRTGEVDIQLAELLLFDGEPRVTVGPTIFSTRRALAVPADHPLAARATVSLEDLALAPLITPAGMPQGFLDVHFPRHTPTGRPIPRGPVASGWQEMLTLIGAGQGVTPASILALDYYARPDVAFVPFNDGPPVDHALLWPATRGRTAKVDAFVQAMTELPDEEKQAALRHYAVDRRRTAPDAHAAP